MKAIKKNNSVVNPMQVVTACIAQVRAMETNLALREPIEVQARHVERRFASRISDAQVEAAAAYAAAHGGEVFGVAFDAAAARTTLELVGSSQVLGRALLRLARRVEDTAIADRADLARLTQACITAAESAATLLGNKDAANALAELRAVGPARRRARKVAAPQTPAQAATPAHATTQGTLQ